MNNNINQNIREKLDEKILNTDYKIIDKVKLNSYTNSLKPPHRRQSQSRHRSFL